jgi:hypothetical protein
MMNCLLNPITDAELNKYNTGAEVYPLDDVYATAPMSALNSAETNLASPSEPDSAGTDLACPWNRLSCGSDGDAKSVPTERKEPTTQALSYEEEVYSSFEQAISGRLEEVQQKLQHLSAVSPSVAHESVRRTTMSVRLSNINWRRLLLFVSFAFTFALLGFDAMGLLVLFAR